MFQNLAVAMDGERGSGAALRRRERRLRAWQRHVRTAVQLALAEKLHHSANKVEPHDALRGQNKRAGREEVENVTRDGLRAHRSLHLRGCGPAVSLTRGRRGAIAPCDAPQGQDPLLVVASLADASADGVDAAFLSFLTASALEARRKEEEEEVRKVQLAQVKAAKKEMRERRQEMVDELLVLRRNFLPSERTPSVERRIAQLVSALEASASSKPPTRKRKKRRKRKTPKFSSSCGRARRRQRQWHVPGPCALQRQVPAVPRVHCVSLRHVVDVPVVRFVQFPQVLFFGFYACPVEKADWISSNDEICADNYIYFRFKLKGKGRSEQWEVFLYGDKTIKVTVIARKCCPGVCLRLALVVSALVLHPTWQRITPSMSCACLLSVAWE